MVDHRMVPVSSSKGSPSSAHAAIAGRSQHQLDLDVLGAAVATLDLQRLNRLLAEDRDGSAEKWTCTRRGAPVASAVTSP